MIKSDATYYLRFLRFARFALSIFTLWYVFVFTFSRTYKNPVFTKDPGEYPVNTLCVEITDCSFEWVSRRFVIILVCQRGVYKNQLLSRYQTSIRDEDLSTDSYLLLLIGSKGQIGRSSGTTQVWNCASASYGSDAMGWRWRWALLPVQQS